MLKEGPIRYIALNALVGKLAGWALAGAIIALDVWALGSLKAATDITGLAAFMLMFVAGTSLGMIQMGVAIMALGADDQKSLLGKALGWLAVGKKPALA